MEKFFKGLLSDALTKYIKNSFSYESLFLVSNAHNKEFLKKLETTKDGLIKFKSTNSHIFKNTDLKKLKTHIPSDPTHSFFDKA